MKKFFKNLGFVFLALCAFIFTFIVTTSMAMKASFNVNKNNVNIFSKDKEFEKEMFDKMAEQTTNIPLSEFVNNFPYINYVLMAVPILFLIASIIVFIKANKKLGFAVILAPLLIALPMNYLISSEGKNITQNHVDLISNGKFKVIN